MDDSSVSEQDEHREQRRIAAADAHQDAQARRRALRVLVGAIIVLAVAVGILGSRALTEASRTSRTVQSAIDQVTVILDASCAFYHDLAILPLQPNSSPALLRIIADSRDTYTGFRCAAVTGPLPSPDHRVVPYLK